MKLLLDTHVFIWWNGDINLLSNNALTAIKNEENELLVSMVSFWEMQIKMQLGKLNFNSPLVDMIEKQKANSNLKIIQLKIEHISAINHLPMYHKDIFDRILIAQSIVENATLVTIDHNITNGYSGYVKTFW